MFQGLRWLLGQPGQARTLPLLLRVGIQLVLMQLGGGLAVAQLTPDTAPDRELGTTVEQSTPGLDRITGGARRGANLFHSFSEFNIDQGQRVYFANPTGVENILSRVTGQNASNILGTLGVEGGANLFLLNPNGIVFGPDAQLDIRGSFVASTASRFQFADGTEFSATNPQAPPLLAVNLTPGLQYGFILPGSTIVNRGNLATGQDLTLVGDRLDLQGQLQAGRDLTLQAQNYVQIQDTVTAPFIAVAGNHALVQGDQFVTISTFNHVSSGFWSGGDLTLRSYNPVVGDAYFYVGRNFQVEQFVGFPGHLSNFNNSVILAAGNVSLGDYQGASLHILAGGSVTLGSVTIYSAGGATTTINPNNTRPLNATKTFADLASVELTDYKAILNSDGSVREVVPVQTPITIDGSSQATLDVRAGVDWAQLGGLPTRPASLGAVPSTPESVEAPEWADIIVSGNIWVSQPSGLVLLTNQFHPNHLEGIVSAQGINTSTNISEASGGDIRLYGRGHVVLGSLYSFIELNASSSSYEGDAGNGGNIFLSSHLGDVVLSYSPLYSNSYSTFGNAGKGGTVSLASYSGDILAIGSSSSLYSYGSFDTGTAVSGGNISFTTNSGDVSLIESSFSLSTGTAGNGGSASLTTNSGDILIADSYLSASGESFSGNAGNGGNISFTTNSGNISLSNTNSHTDSLSFGGDAGNGGNFSFTTNSGNISLSNSFLLSESSSDMGNSGKGGNIAFITNSGSISLSNSGSASRSEAGLGNSGNGGNIALSSISGHISLSNWSLTSSSLSDVGIAGKGGNISMTTSSGDISLSNTRLSSYSFSTSGTAGRGGDISLSAYSGNIIGSASSLSSFAVSLDSSKTSGDGGNVSLTVKNQISNLEIFTQSLSASAGAVNITGIGDLTLTNLEISTSKTVSLINPFTGQTIAFTPGEKGRSGEVIITGSGNLTFENTVIQSATQGSDPAGNIRITSPGAVAFNNTQLVSNTNSTGQAGNVTIDAGQGIIFTDHSRLFATTTSTGNAGNITLNTPTLTVAGDAEIAAETSGSGQGGTITVNAPTAINLMRVQDFSPVLSVETSGAGLAGNITLNTPTLTLADQARITATATATATNPQGGGSITINASNMNLAGIVGVFAETQGQAPAGTLTLNPYNNQLDLNIALTSGSRISASTFASGNGGDLVVAAPRSITLAGPGQLAVETSGTGNAGNITLTTEQLTLKDGVEVSASTSGSGTAGDIAINANVLTISQGARVSTNTTGTGQAGNITVTVPEQITLTGQGTGLFASTTLNSTGNGGSITIDPQFLLIESGAAIAVDSQGSGQGGNITVQSNHLELRDYGSITAQTASNQGGNITLNVQDLLLLRRNSQISATAGTAQAGGDGGNITINVPNGFILAVPNENSDITANAFTGRGGNVQITAQGILGLQYRSQLTPESDITASSEFGINGTVTLNTPNVDPNQGLIALPTGLVDPAGLLTQRCAAQRNRETTSSFYITGRGGLPYRPGDLPLSQFSTGTVRPAVETTATSVSTVQPGRSPDSQANLSQPVIEATQWARDAAGNVFLVADAGTAPAMKVAECPPVAP